MVSESGSAKAVAPSSKHTPCFFRFDVAFRESHSNVKPMSADHYAIGAPQAVQRSAPEPRRPIARVLPQREDTVGSTRWPTSPGSIGLIGRRPARFEYRIQ